MIKRVIENWLINASEKAFQIPFCQLLVDQGYTVVHLTRHCSLEMGKDIIAVDKGGIPTAFQLKATGKHRVTKNEWRRVLLPQVTELVEQAITHPAVNSSKAHIPVLVINGELEEETQIAIQQYNKHLKARHFSKPLKIIVRGQLLKMFLEFSKSLVPSELKDEKALLEIYLLNGNETFPKRQFAELLESVLPLKGKRINKAALARTITASAILTALSLSSFCQASNHVACFDAWTLYCAHILCLAEKQRLKKTNWEPSLQLGIEAMFSSLKSLSEEIYASTSFVVGDRISDVPFYKIRITHLVGLIALMGLKKKQQGEDVGEEMQFIRKNRNIMTLWGEYAIPQFLAAILFLAQVEPASKVSSFIGGIVKTLARLGNRELNHLLPGPEIDPEEFVLDVCIRNEEERANCYCRGSYTIEAMLHLYTRYNLKQNMKILWPEVSRVEWKSFIPDKIDDFYRWQIQEGNEHGHYPVPTQSWNQLRNNADESRGEHLPNLIKNYPLLYLSFLIVCPHRLNANGVRWLDTILQESIDSE